LTCTNGTCDCPIQYFNNTYTNQYYDSQLSECITQKKYLEACSGIKGECQSWVFNLVCLNNTCQCPQEGYIWNGDECSMKLKKTIKFIIFKAIIFK
jgi:hypothetical protein